MLFAAAFAFADVSVCVPGNPLYIWPPDGSLDAPIDTQAFAIVNRCEAEGTDVTLVLLQSDGSELAVAEQSVAPGEMPVLLPLGPAPYFSENVYTLRVLPELYGGATSAFTVVSDVATPLPTPPVMSLSDAVGAGAADGEVTVTLRVPSEGVAVRVSDADGAEVWIGANEEEERVVQLPVSAEGGEELCLTVSARDGADRWTEGNTDCIVLESPTQCGLVAAGPGAGLSGVAGLLAFAGRRRRR